MLRPKRLLTLLLSLAIFCSAMPSAFAIEMVSAAVNTLNMRSGPGATHPAQWTVDKGYPFKVIGHKGKWLKVTDFVRDSGWVYGPMTSKTRHHIVSASTGRLRARPTTRSAIVMQAAKGDVLRTLQQRGHWIKVRHANGRVGWIAKSRVWGW